MAMENQNSLDAFFVRLSKTVITGYNFETKEV